MPADNSALLKALTAAAYSDVEEDWILYLVDPEGGESGNYKITPPELRRALLAASKVTVTVSSGVTEQAITWDDITGGAAPTTAPLISFYPSNLDTTATLAWIKGGTLSATGCTINLSNADHTGGLLTVLFPY